MAKILLRGETHPVHVSEEEASRILNQKNDPKHKSTIRVGTREISKGVIREVVFGSGVSAVRKYDLNKPEDRQLIKEFEMMLAAHELGTMPNPIEYYGDPHEAFAQRHGLTPRPGHVFNPLCGLVHWSTVQYALTENLIRYHEASKSWAIVSHGLSADNIDTGAYDDFKAKLEALKDLRGRRAYMEGKKTPSLEVLDESRETFEKQTEIPLPF